MTSTARTIRCTLLASVAMAILGWPVGAIIIRHDREDRASLELGSHFPAAGQVLPDGGCALIAPNWVITAAHVAAGMPADGARIRFERRDYPVRRVVLHPEANVKPGRPPEVDLALVELSEPVKAVPPWRIYRKGDELGKTVTIVGYGDLGDGLAAPRRGDGKRRAATNVISDVGPRLIFCQFDAPPEGTTLEGVGGPGDSGGPAVIETAGSYEIAGISTASMGGKPGRYGVVDVYTRVSAYAPWIDATIGSQPDPQ